MSIAEQTLKEARSLQEYINYLNDDVATIRADGRKSDAYKAELVQQQRAYWSAAAAKHATASWQSANRRVKEAEAKMKAVAANREKGVDFKRIDVLAQEYAAALRAPANVLIADTPIRRVKAIADEARRRGDQEQLRAIRIASADYVSRTGANDSDGAIAAELRREFARDVEAETAEIRAAEREYSDAEKARDQLRSTILEVEEAVTGKPQSTGIFSTPSEWQRTILGETPEALGLIVTKN